MQGRWDSKSSTILQQHIKTALDPIVARRNYYVLAKANMFKSVSAHFFTDMNKEKFLEVTRFFADNPEVEPVSMQLLAIQFDTLEQFSQTIKDSGLGLELEGDYFVFNSSEGMKPETIEFMKKLTLALSACRICIGMEQIYRTSLAHPHIQTEEFKQYLQQVNDLTNNYKAGPKPGDDYGIYLRAYYQCALAIQKNLKEQYIQVNAWKEPFAELMQNALAVICEAIKVTGLKLIEGTNEFPDKTWLGDGWSKFVVGLISELVARYYHYAYVISGPLSLNLEYLAILSTELSTFSKTMQDQMAHLKLAFLNEAGIEIEALIRNIQDEAGIQRIVLIEERQMPYSSGALTLLFKQPDDSQRRNRESYPQFADPRYEF